MSSARTSSAATAAASGSRASAPASGATRDTTTTTGLLPPSTPASSKTASFRKRSLKPMSAKQLNKITRNLVAVERSTRTHSSTAEGEDEGAEGYTISEEGRGAGRRGMAEEEEYLTREIVEETRIRGPARSTLVDQLIGAGSSKGGLPASAVASSSSYRGAQTGSSSSSSRTNAKTAAAALIGPSSTEGAVGENSFHHESSFVLNPLKKRTTVPATRVDSGAATGQASGKGKGAADRPGIDGAYVGMQEPEVPPLKGADKPTQEALIMEDVLYALQGIEGDYIHFQPTYQPSNPAHPLRGPQFLIDEHLDPSLRDLVGRILPLATHYTSIVAFIELESTLTFGTVAHALCSAIRDLVKEYEILIAQLEKQYQASPSFTLQKLWFYVHPTLRSLSLIHAFTSEVAAISHADILEEDEEDEEDDDEDEDAAELESNASLERQRRALLGLDDPDEDEAIEGGIVKGGEILAMLWERITRMNGDPSARSLYFDLFRRASVPYKNMLLKWISTGHLSDVYDEFIVMEDTRVTRASLESDPTDEYWERRYTLRDETILAAREQLRQQGFSGFDEEADDGLDGDNGDEEAQNPRGVLTGGAKLPAFLEPWKEKILLAGKYLNVIRECGIDVANPQLGVDIQAEEDSLVISDPAFLKHIESAYERANTTLLNLLITEQHIIDRLRSVKHYFVMEKGDFFASFYEQSLRDLRRIISSGRAGSTPTRLGQQLGMVLGSSTTVGSDDPYKEDLRIECTTEKVYTQLMRIAETKGAVEAAKAAKQQKKEQAAQNLKVMDVLQFDIVVKFPVSLVISKKNILRWQFLQRVLLHLKILEKQLMEMWLEHQEGPWREFVKGHAPLQEWKRRIFKLRHSMTFVIQQLLSFITSEVIEPGWSDLEIKMANAKTVDQFMRDHFDFLNTTRKEAMLTDFKYLTYHTRMTTVVEYFVDLRTHLRDQLHEERARWETRKDGEAVALNPEILTFFDQVEKAWVKGVKNFRDCVILLSTTENPAATPLAHKLQAATLY